VSSGSLRAQKLVTATGDLPKRGASLGEPLVINDAVISWSDGSIDYVGPFESYRGSEPKRTKGTVVPGFVDCHTHLPFFGWRADEFAARLRGVTYRDLHGEGGIFRSARLFNEASDTEVLEFCRDLLDEMLRHGTTTVEFKTGYALSVEGELRQAQLARRLATEITQNTSLTLLACHAVPPGETREGWVEKACRELIPAAASEQLVDQVDIYVEDIAFSVEDLEAVATAADKAGLPLRCHVEQLSNLHAAERAGELGAISVDHLNHIDTAGVSSLGRSPSVATLLPASTLVLGSEPPPARALIDAGAAVAIATDFNPGTSPVLSMPETIAFACTLYKLSPEEAFVAATANAACVLGQNARVGTLEVGKRADFVVLERDIADIPYRPGHNPVTQTVSGGVNV